MTEADARITARHLQSLYDDGQWDPWAETAPARGETVAEYAKRCGCGSSR